MKTRLKIKVNEWGMDWKEDWMEEQLKKDTKKKWKNSCWREVSYWREKNHDFLWIKMGKDDWT